MTAGLVTQRPGFNANSISETTGLTSMIGPTLPSMEY
jgi:hypothetical protein